MELIGCRKVGQGPQQDRAPPGNGGGCHAHPHIHADLSLHCQQGQTGPVDDQSDMSELAVMRARGLLTGTLLPSCVASRKALERKRSDSWSMQRPSPWKAVVAPSSNMAWSLTPTKN